MPDDFLSHSEQQFRQRVRDLEVWVWAVDQRQQATAATLAQSRAENARLRRALRVLAKLQNQARVRDAILEVLNDG